MLKGNRKGPGRVPWVVRALLATYPSKFRRRFEADFLEAYLAERARTHAARAWWGAKLLAARTVVGLVPGMMGEWWVHFRGRWATIRERRRDRPDGRMGVMGMMGRIEPWLLEIKILLRGLVRTPGFTLAVIVTLGLGVGSTTAMFELADRLLLRPPHGLRDPDGMHRLLQSRATPNGRSEQTAFSYPALVDLTREGAGVADVVGHGLSRQIVTVGDRPEPRWIMGLTGDYWSQFDVSPVVGRSFGPEEDRPPLGADVAVLAHDYWRDAFGGDPGVGGRTIRIGDRIFTVIGVAPPGFRGLDLWDASIYLPLSALSSVHLGPDFADRPFTTWLALFARIPAGSEPAARHGLTAAFTSHYARVRDAAFARERDARIALGPVLWYRGPFGDETARFSLWLLGTGAAVLLVACANVVTLLLGRALRRRRESAVRAALGMSTARAVVLPVLESLILAGLAAAVALPLGSLLSRLVSRRILPDLLGEFGGLSGRAYLFATGLVILTGTISGAVARFRVRESRLGAALRAGSPGAGRSRSRVLAALPPIQAAFSAVLLVGSGLFIRSLIVASTVELGYDTERIVAVELEGGGAFRNYIRGEDRTAIRRMEGLLERARSIPGVRAASLTTAVPYVSREFSTILLEGGRESASVDRVSAARVDADYFRVMGTRILRGREFEEGEVGGGAPVAVVSESLAARLWPAGEALGACFHPEADTLPCHRVVGVAEDLRSEDLSERELRYYLPWGLATQRFGGNLVLHLEGPPEVRVEEVRQELQAGVPPGIYVRVRPMKRIVGDELERWRAGATILGAFGLLALVIAGFGSFSVIAYQVSRRRREFGIRIALGARGADLMALVLRKAVGGAAWGVGVGLLLAWVLSEYLREFLLGVGPRDPLTYGLVASILLGSAAVACLSPALRAAAQEPREVLNTE